MAEQLEIRTDSVRFDGHRICYRVAGSGPALVLVKPHRVPRDYVQLWLLANRFTLLQINPLGYGASDRPREYPPGGLHEQILAVVDREGIDRFAIWGYSKGAPMAAAVAQASTRVVAMVAGAYPLIGHPTEVRMRQIDRDPRLPAGPRAFWHWYSRFDWHRELANMRCSKLCYVGIDDHIYAPLIRRIRGPLEDCRVDFMEFEGLDHQSCNSDPALSAMIAPAVVGWLSREVPTGW